MWDDLDIAVEFSGDDWASVEYNGAFDIEES